MSPQTGLCDECDGPLCPTCDCCAACEGHREDCKWATPPRRFYRPPKRIRQTAKEGE